MHSPTHTAMMAVQIAAGQIYDLVTPDKLIHDACGCTGKRYPNDPVCACAMKDYLRDGDDWYKVEVTLTKV